MNKKPKEVLRLELLEQMQVLCMLHKQLEGLLNNNKWDIATDRIVFKNENINNLYYKTCSMYENCAIRIECIEEECRLNKYYDILTECADYKFQNGL